MPTFPSTPAPAICRDEPVQKDTIITQFEGGYEVRRNRWHRHKKQFVLMYKTIVSATSSVQAIEDHTIIRNFILSSRLQKDSFTFVHPYYPSSIYTVRYAAAMLPQVRKVRTTADGGTDVFEMEIRLVEVF